MICPECNGKGEIKYYRLVRGEHTMTVDGFLDVCHTCHGSGVKITSNADHIRSLSDEELAEFLMRIMANAVCFGEGVFPYHPCPQDQDCKKCGLNWLKQPYKEDT